MYVDKATVSSLNSGQDKLEDILVLHLHGGKDFFVSFVCLEWREDVAPSLPVQKHIE